MEIKSKTELDGLISSSADKTLIIKFHALWCSPCLALTPIMDRIQNEDSNIIVAHINIDDNSELSAEYGVRGIPAVFIVKKGEVVNKFTGLKQESDIKKLL